MTQNQLRAREWLVAVGVGAVLVCLMTWPTAPGLLTHGRLDTADGRFSIWNVGWIGHALTSSDTLLDANIFYPHLGTLAYSELNLVAGLLGLPTFVATGSALGATNTAILAGLLATFLATWALVRRLTGSAVAGLVSATGFTFLPFVQAHTAHIQLLMTFGMPLVLLAFHALRDRMSVMSAAGLGVALAIAGLACAYYGIFAGLTLGLIALLLARRDRAYWIALARRRVGDGRDRCAHLYSLSARARRGRRAAVVDGRDPRLVSDARLVSQFAGLCARRVDRTAGRNRVDVPGLRADCPRGDRRRLVVSRGESSRAPSCT